MSRISHFLLFAMLMVIIVLSIYIYRIQTIKAPPLSQSSAPTHPSHTTGDSPSAVRADEPVPPLILPLNPAKGQEIGAVYQAFLSPHQEPGEEANTPSLIPNEFHSTLPSLTRDERNSRGHGILRFTYDLSKAYIDVSIEGVTIETINMFHIHCGRPDLLGPILVDFALMGDIQANFGNDNVFSVTITNNDITATSAAGHGLVGAFTAGCPIIPGLPDDVKTIAGMAYIAQQGELYFNLHTQAQTFYGDIRGQLYPISLEEYSGTP